MDRRHSNRLQARQRSSPFAARETCGLFSFFTIGRLLFVTLTLLTVIGCGTSRIDKLEKQNQEILSRLHQQGAAQDFDLQAKCSQSAKTYFTEIRENYKSGPDYNLPINQILETMTYTNHYNKSLNKCLIRIQFEYSRPNRGTTDSISVDDVYEHDNLASFYGSADGVTRPTACSVDHVNCASSSDFEDKIEPLMTK